MVNNKDVVALKQFGDHLRALRNAKGLSQQTLALNANIAKNQVGNIERGEVNITLITATRIAQTLEVSLTELFDFAKD